MSKISLDTGVISIFLSNNPTNQVISLMGGISKGEISAYLPKTVLIEAFFHVCKNDGLENAKVTLVNFLAKYPLNLVEFDENLIYYAGQLKCQHRNSLSYIDCMGIAIALTMKIPFHTTEKKIKNITSNVFQKLKIVKYSF